MNLRYAHIIFLLIACYFNPLHAQETFMISGVVQAQETNAPLEGATILIEQLGLVASSDVNGYFELQDLLPGEYEVKISFIGRLSEVVSLLLDDDSNLNISMVLNNVLSEDVTVIGLRETSGIQRLRDVENTAIYASKKNELVLLDQLTINKASNVSRQIYSKVSGLNIWESDGAGVQLGLGGRGLSPSRNSNFNTRQNGYDISADALGYPESYYTPPSEALERIEVIRGAASLQYGTQFGGMINFKFKEGRTDKKINFSSRMTRASYGFLNSFSQLGGTLGKWSYYGYYQYKKSDSWRPNSNLSLHNVFLSTKYSPSNRFSVKAEYTHSSYLAQQPGGLTDAEFEMNPEISKRARNWFAVDWNLFALEGDYKINDRLKINSRFFGLLAGRDALGNLDNINLIDFGENRDFLNDDYKNWGHESRIIYRYSTNNLPSTAIFGLRYYDGLTLRKQGDGTDGSDANFRYLNPDNLEGSDFRLPSRNIAIFAENVFNLTKKWSITPGVRMESIQTNARGYYREITTDLAGNIINDVRIEEDKKNQRSFLFFGIGSSLKPLENMEIYANFSQNYRAINFNDIRVDVGSLVVDENLDDERGYTLDLGIRGRIGRFLSYDMTAYHLSYNDRIGTILKKEPNPVFNGLVDRVVRFRTNIADASIYGFESVVDLDLSRLFSDRESDTRINWFSNFSLTRAKYQSIDGAIDGNEVELVPDIIFKTGVNIAGDHFGANLQYSYTGSHFSDASNAIRTPTAIEGIIPSYDVLDFSLSYSFKNFIVESGVNNLLDNIYFTRRATGYPGPGIIPAERRSIYLTVGVEL